MTDYCEINYDKNMQMLSMAIKYCGENLLHDDLINELYNDNDLKKQLCLIELKYIKNQKEADILVYNLVNHSGPVRETASFKILEIIQNSDFCRFFQTAEIYDTFVKSVTDINPSVSRNAVEIIKYVDNPQYIYEKLVLEINKTLQELKDIRQNHSYTANKKNFNLYWNLEAVINLANSVKAGDELIKILEQTAISPDYTIREKTAKTAYTYGFKQILKLLAEDDNIYVRKYL